MQASTIPRRKSFLRSPTVIVAEISVIALAGVAGVVFPQAGDGGREQVAQFCASMPGLAAVAHALALDRVFRSAWFLCAVAMAFASLLVVVISQFQRLLRSRTWPGLALLGGPIIHIGLLLVIVAATLKLLFGAEAVVDLLEGEALPPTAAAWSVQQPGVLAAPIRMNNPLTLESVDAHRYAAGDLQSLAVRLRLATADPKAPSSVAEIPVNQCIKSSGVRLFVGSDYGPAALIEWRGTDSALARTAVMLKHARGQQFEGELAGPDGARAYLRTSVSPNGNHPAGIEVRVMKNATLRYAGIAQIGETIALPSGESLALRGTPFWVRLHANRDPGLWLVYLGFALVFAGMTLRFALLPLPQTQASRLAVPLRQRQPNDLHLPQPAALLFLACVVLLSGCNEAPLSQARKLVERYNTTVSEAYRRGDVKLIDPVVGPKEGKKLTGLIGVRLDLGIALDSHLLSLDVLEAKHVTGKLRVRTRERWTYCDRRIGTGEPIGEATEDNYEMLYFFTRAGRDWLVDRIEFATPPQLGRQPSTWAVANDRTPRCGAAPAPASSGGVP